jgi:hypothetical protein
MLRATRRMSYTEAVSSSTLSFIGADSNQSSHSPRQDLSAGSSGTAHFGWRSAFQLRWPGDVGSMSGYGVRIDMCMETHHGGNMPCLVSRVVEVPLTASDTTSSRGPFDRLHAIYYEVAYHHCHVPKPVESKKRRASLSFLFSKTHPTMSYNGIGLATPRGR